MDISDIYTTVHQFVVGYPVIAGIVGIVLLIFLWQKPWEFLRIFLIVLVLACAAYYFTYLTSSADFGAKQKRAITTEREENLEKN